MRCFNSKNTVIYNCVAEKIVCVPGILRGYSVFKKTKTKTWKLVFIKEAKQSRNYQSRCSHMKVNIDVKMRDGTMLTLHQCEQGWTSILDEKRQASSFPNGIVEWTDNTVLYWHHFSSEYVFFENVFVSVIQVAFCS